MQPEHNLNLLWASWIVDELVRCGVSMFFIAPGSRSTPLVAAVARHPQAQAVVHLDERATAFAALGYGRGAGRAAAWVTTSGTAAANGLPAVVEASQDGAPMLLVTADRPPELRDAGANQAIRQPGLFGDYVRWQCDLPAPEAAVPPHALLTTVDQAVYRAHRAPGGPVHLNVPFREPLAPTPDGGDYAAYAAGLVRRDDGPYTRWVAPALSPAGAEAFAARLGGRGVIVAADVDDPEAVHHLALRLGWPVLPDVRSGMRLGAAARPAVCAPPDGMLAGEAWAAAHRPEVALLLGARPVSKRLQGLLDGADLPAVVHDGPERIDPGHRAAWRFEAAAGLFCRALAEALPSGWAPDPDWLPRWQRRARAVQAAHRAALDGADALTEPGVARRVSELLPAGHGLVLASSMPVRDMDAFAVVDGAEAPVAANRGASGIDGTLATAAGFVLGRGAPATLVVGDLAFLYDLNALELVRRLPHPLTIVLLNNDGGGIFSFLPIADFPDLFEPYFGVPHGLAFADTARQFGLEYAQPRTPGAFEAAYRAAAAGGRSTLIEVQTERAANHALHGRLLEQAWQAGA